jgi:hypothetical protein
LFKIDLNKFFLTIKTICKELIGKLSFVEYEIDT